MPWLQILCVQSVSTEPKLILVPRSHFLQSNGDWSKPLWVLLNTDFWDKDKASELGLILGPIVQHMLSDPSEITHFLRAHNSILWKWREDSHSLLSEDIISQSNQQTSMPQPDVISRKIRMRISWEIVCHRHLYESTVLWNGVSLWQEFYNIILFTINSILFYCRFILIFPPTFAKFLKYCLFTWVFWQNFCMYLLFPCVLYDLFITAYSI